MDDFRQGTLMDCGLILPDDDHGRMDIAESLQAKWQVQPGQLWELGDHVIVCGDCLDPDTVSSVFKFGEDPHYHLLVTDPPWNVEYGSKILADLRPNAKKKNRLIENDDLEEDYPYFATCYTRMFKSFALPGAMAYVFMSSKEWPCIDDAMRAAHFHWSSTIIWVKDRPIVPSNKEYFPRYEAIWYGWDDRKARLHPITQWNQNDVWEVPRPMRSDEHPTMKPVELAARAIRNSSNEGDIVFDPFGGSGFVLVAAEKLHRRARIIEKVPKFVAVTIQRWVDETGKDPVLWNKIQSD